MLLFLRVGAHLVETNYLNRENQNNMEQEQTAIEAVLSTYEEALNTSDVAKVLSIYHDDGVFMPTELPTAKGTKALRESYTAIFSQIQLSIKFRIEEIEITGDMAFATTYSKGTVKVLAPGIEAPEENRELFVFQKREGVWKVARYMFNKMSKPE